VPPVQVTRRGFLKGVAVGAVAAGVAAAPASRRRAPNGLVEELAEEHAGDRAMLIDLTRCVGCGKCVRACKHENDLGWREDQPALGPDAALASSNWSIVRSFGRVGADGQPRYTKRQCMHCLEPACVSACFVKALKKTPGGWVTYDGDMCVGCRYCLMVCPFNVPTFEWDETFGRVSKCDFCDSRALRGQPTACSEVCPTGAITFGSREELLAEAHRRIAEQPARERDLRGGAEPRRYTDHVYGETEGGGTSMLYLSDVPFEELGFPTGMPDTPLPWYTWQISKWIPPAAGMIGTGIIAIYARRRRAILESQSEHAYRRAEDDRSDEDEMESI
jgi:formate dehydrogenase iron-sulfur subunit